jgi:hypothetical protein
MNDIPVNSVVSKIRGYVFARRSGLPMGLCALHLFTLCSLSFAQPIYEVTAKDPAFFVVRGSKPIDILSLILILSVIIPAALLILEALLRLVSMRAHLAVHAVVMAILFALYGTQIVKTLQFLDGFLAIILACLLGTGGGILYLSANPFRVFITLVSPVCLLFPVLFIFGSQVHKVVFPGSQVSQKPHNAALNLQLQNKPPIFFIVMDELPTVSLLDAEGKIDPNRFPHLANFAKTAYWFRHATTASTFTTSAIPAALSGVLPTKRLLPIVKDHPNTLFTLLKDDYEFNVREPVTHICPSQLSARGSDDLKYSPRMTSLLSDLSIVYMHIVFPFRYSRHLPPIDCQWGNFAARAAQEIDPTDPALGSEPFKQEKRWEKKEVHRFLKTSERLRCYRDFICNIREDAHGTLNFIHFMMPHPPWLYLPSGKKHSKEGRIAAIARKNDKYIGPQEAVTQYHHRHLLQLAFSDELLGSLFDHLKQEKLFDDSLIVITSDHGASFEADDFRRRLSKRNIADILFVPLLLKLPGQREQVISNVNANTADIVPTIAQVLDITLPWHVTGRSLIARDRERRSETVIWVAEGGRAQTFEFGKLQEAMGKALARNVSRFSLHDERSTLFRFGKYMDYIGKSLEEFEIIEDTIAFSLDQDIPLCNVHASANLLPCSLSGKVRYLGEGDRAPTYAFSVNGVIQSFSVAFRIADEFHLSTIIPEHALRLGMNEVDLYLVETEDSGKIVLRGRQRNADEYKRGEKFLLDSDANSLIRGNGIQYPIAKPGIIGGKVEKVMQQCGNIVFEGWAENTKAKEPPDQVLMLDEGKLISATRPDLPVRSMGRGVRIEPCAWHGFRFVVAKAEVLKFKTMPSFYAISSHPRISSKLDFSRNALWTLAVIGDQPVDESPGKRPVKKDDALFVLKGDIGRERIRFNNQITVLDSPDVPLKQLVIMATGHDPYLWLPPLDYPKFGEVSVIIDITCPGESQFLQVYYLTEGQGKYAGSRSVKEVTEKGRNVVCLRIPEPGVVGRLRIDPGQVQGKYLIHKIVVRAERR